MEQLRALLDPR